MPYNILLRLKPGNLNSIFTQSFQNVFDRLQVHVHCMNRMCLISGNIYVFLKSYKLTDVFEVRLII